MRDLRGLLLASVLAAGAASAPAVAEPALWEVTGGESTVWIFGSVHLLPEGGFAPGDSLGNAIEAAERVCLEIDPGAQDEAETASVPHARAVDPQGRDLFELLGTDAGCAISRPTSR